jgi:hypothetical protein
MTGQFLGPSAYLNVLRTAVNTCNNAHPQKNDMPVGWLIHSYLTGISSACVGLIRPWMKREVLSESTTIAQPPQKPNFVDP